MKKILWWLFVVRLSLRWIGRLNLGDQVVFEGKRWRLNQGVADPYWALAREDEYLERVHRDKFRKVRGPRAAWTSFRSGYRFYMGYWFDIWVRQGVEPWMLGCAIWAGKPPKSN
jgi:hypothetical protein